MDTYIHTHIDKYCVFWPGNLVTLHCCVSTVLNRLTLPMCMQAFSLLLLNFIMKLILK